MAELIGAIEGGGTKFVLALAGGDGAIIERTKLETAEASRTLEAAVDWFEAAAGAHGTIAAFGIGSFGPIGIDPDAPDYGQFGATPKPGWRGASYRQALATFGAALAIDTDVNAAALGEWAARGGTCATLAYTTVGTGIGTGVVKEGRIVVGASHYESGHVLARRDAQRDAFAGLCPYHGDCLEGLASGPAVQARWGHDLSHGTPEHVALVAGYLADLASTLILLHMPDLLVFGGGVMKAPGLLDSLRAQTRERLGGYVPGWEGCLSHRISGPLLGDDAGITGAIAMGRRALARN